MLRAFLVVVLFASCSGAKGGPSMNNSMTAANDPKPQTSDVISTDILAREPISNSAMVKHILIGWNEGGDQPHDPRAQKRTKKDAEAQVRALMTQLKGGADFDALMKQWSEDPGSAGSARAYAVAPDAQLVIEFKQLGLRLKVGEVGVVQSDYGFHIMKRIE
ncbi:MAG: peptidylprolyl isomerase [Kofleriaceae bacterium]